MKVGVIGAGTMGMGIVQVFAQMQGNIVLVNDVSREFAVRGIDKMSGSLDRLVMKGKMTADQKVEIMARVSAAEKADFSDCDLVIEAAIENLSIKKAAFTELDGICKDDCIFATNTSSLSITEIGAGIKHPLAGMHFFNPAPVMKLVELIAGIDTSCEVMDRLKSIAEEAGKVPVEVQDSAGFVVNRMLIPMINEAIGIFAEGVASADDIDNAMKLGANHPIGPLALGDLVGLDVCLAIMEVLQNETGDSKYRPHPLLRKMVRGGRLGKKTGKGFFTYN